MLAPRLPRGIIWRIEYHSLRSSIQFPFVDPQYVWHVYHIDDMLAAPILVWVSLFGDQKTIRANTLGNCSQLNMLLLFFVCAVLCVCAASLLQSWQVWRDAAYCFDIHYFIVSVSVSVCIWQCTICNSIYAPSILCTPHHIVQCNMTKKENIPQTKKNHLSNQK